MGIWPLWRKVCKSPRAVRFFSEMQGGTPCGVHSTPCRPVGLSFSANSIFPIKRGETLNPWRSYLRSGANQVADTKNFATSKATLRAFFAIPRRGVARYRATKLTRLTTASGWVADGHALTILASFAEQFMTIVARILRKIRTGFPLIINDCLVSIAARPKHRKQANVA